jgi:DNA-binding transcriptional ArsR family regulator
MAGWAFLTNHGLVLIYIAGHPDSTGREIAAAVGITERAVRAIVDDLRAAGYVEPEKVGRRNRYRVNPGRPVPYLGERAVTVGELLALLWRGEVPDHPGARPGGREDRPPDPDKPAGSA